MPLFYNYSHSGSMRCHVVWMIVTSGMEEHTATSFRVEETKIQVTDSSEMDPV